MKKLLIGFIMMMALFAFTACGDSSSASSSDGDSQDQAAGQSAAVSEPSEHNTLSEDPTWWVGDSYRYEKIVFGKLSDYKSKVKQNLKDGDIACMTDELLAPDEIDQAGIIAVMDDDEDVETCYVLSDDIMYFPEKVGTHFFSPSGRLTEIVFENVSTENVTDMSAMFMHLDKLETLDLSSFDTHNVTDMFLMFSDCSSLQTVDLSSFDTSNVEEMGMMFDGCVNLKSLDLSNFKTDKLTGMNGAFKNCDSLEELDLSSFNGDNLDAVQQDETFLSCDNLRKVIVSQSLYDYFSFDGSSLFKNGKEVVIK